MSRPNEDPAGRVLRGPHCDDLASKSQATLRDWSVGQPEVASLILATSPLLIVGASVRAAAQAARRSGWTKLIGLDLFRDLDWPDESRGGQVSSLDLRPGAGDWLDAVLSSAQAWIYTGAMENRPQVVARLARRVALIGNPSAVIRQVRDPLAVASALRGCRLPFAETRRTALPTLPEGQWLCKPRRSMGGQGIRLLAGPRETLPCRGSYYQRYLPGPSCAAVFLAAAGQPRLVGVTRQLIGDRRFGADGFRYAGSIGPLVLSERQQHRWEQVGQALCAAFPLQGLFGVDAIETEQGVVPVEVNPRYTASMEVVERIRDWPLIAWHVLACRTAWLPAIAAGSVPRCGGKAILYADQLCQWTEAGESLRRELHDADRWPTAADIPHVGTLFSPSNPILTVLADGAEPGEVQQKLLRRARSFGLLSGRSLDLDHPALGQRIITRPSTWRIAS